MIHLKKHVGISLVEILVSLAIFSIGIVGLYLSIQSMNKNLAVSMQRDVEATYANMLISQVNPYILTAAKDEGSGGFDLTDNNNKGVVNMPDGRKAYYLREVKQKSYTEGDMLEVNIYFYRNANDAASSPYRHFKREIPVTERNYQATSTSTAVTKDSSGNVWTSIPRTQQHTLGDATDPVPGFDLAASGALQNPATDAECGEYHLGNAASDRLVYVFPGTQNHDYKVELQLCEPTDAATAGSRIMEVLINDVLTDEVDIVSQAGAPNTFITKSYTAQPINYLGVYLFKVELRRKSGSPDVSPVLERIRVIR